MSPRLGLDKDAVVRAAADLLNAEGPDALTLGRLAEKLGVKPPSLYNHVAGLPGLYRALAVHNARLLGERMAEAAVGKAGPEAVQAIAQAYRAYIHENPGLYLSTLRASGREEAPDPELVQAEERALRVALSVLAAFGLAGQDALHAARGLGSLVHGFATLEVAGGFGLPLDLEESFRRLVAMYIRRLG